MPRIRLTEKTVAKLLAPTAIGKPVIYWDEGPRAVRGFGVLCSGKTNTRSYVAQRDLPGSRTRRVTIAGVNGPGPCPCRRPIGGHSARQRPEGTAAVTHAGRGVGGLP